MLTVQIVVDAPLLNDFLGMPVVAEQMFVEATVTQPALKGSTKPFCMGCPGAMDPQ